MEKNKLLLYTCVQLLSRSTKTTVELRAFSPFPTKQLIFVPTFDTKETEYLCSGWVFFSSDKLRLFDQSFLTEFFYHSKGIVVLSSNLKRYFTCDHFS